MADDLSNPVFPGHLGHLSPAQEEALATFKANLAEANLYTFPSNPANASHDDPTLLYVQTVGTGAAILTHFFGTLLVGS